MPSNPPTVEDLDAEVTGRCGLVLHDAGLFLRALDGSSPPAAISPVVRRGLMEGFIAVGATPLDPLVLADPDVAALSAQALKRVVDVAEMFSLEQCLLGWWRVTQEEQPALSPTPMAGGWRVDEKNGVKNRVSELKAICGEPYREQTAQVVAGHRDFVHPGFDPLRNPLWGWEGYW